MTAPQIPDTAVEAYLLGAALPDGGRPDMTGHEYVAYVQRTYSTGDLIRAGLAAALPHLIPAAPSGETAPGRAVAMSWDWREQPNLNTLGLLLDALTDGGIQLYEVDTGSDQYGIVVADVELTADQVAETYGRATEPGALPVVEVPADAGVAAASVPARTNAQATPPDLDAIAARIGDPGQYTPRRDGESVTRWSARAVADLLAAPSGEQPTAEPVTNTPVTPSTGPDAQV